MFLKNLAKCAPLYDINGKKEILYGGEEHQSAFEKHQKLHFTSEPILALPNNSDPFILDTDASDWAIGAELIQIQGGYRKGHILWKIVLSGRTETLLYHQERASSRSTIYAAI